MSETMVCLLFTQQHSNIVCDRLVQLCVRQLPSSVSHENTEHSDTDRDAQRASGGHSGASGGESGGNGDSGASAVSTCLLTSLRLLLNITHDNSQSSLNLSRCSVMYSVVARLTSVTSLMITVSQVSTCLVVQ